MFNLRMHISYDGTPFHGWQKQPDQPSIQQELEDCLSQVFGEPISVVGSGRTDAGVHALEQVAHARIPKSPEGLGLIDSLNQMTDPAISIHRTLMAPEDFHAQRSAERKTYRYFIENSPVRDPLQRNFRHWIRKPLDLHFLNECCEFIQGNQDFMSFQSQGTPVPDTQREVFMAQWSQPKEGLIQFEVQGNGFLKQMVRNLVGTMLYLENGMGSPSDMREILEARDRTVAKTCAPPQGLYLCWVKYPPELDNKCRDL